MNKKWILISGIAVIALVGGYVFLKKNTLFSDANTKATNIPQKVDRSELAKQLVTFLKSKGIKFMTPVGVTEDVEIYKYNNTLSNYNLMTDDDVIKWHQFQMAFKNDRDYTIEDKLYLAELYKKYPKLMV